MANIITTRKALREMVAHYATLRSWAFDVETIGPDRADAHIAPVSWISFACDSRTDTIPMDFPNGDLLGRDPILSGRGRQRLIKGVDISAMNPRYDFLKGTVPRFGPPPDQLPRGVVFEELAPLFRSRAVKVGHNIKFDLHAVAKYIGGHPDGPYYDTLVASWLLDVSLTGKGKLGLADCVEREVGYTLVKGVGADVSQHDFLTVAKYSQLDAEWTWRLAVALEARYGSLSPAIRRLLELEMAVIHPVLEMEQTGTRIDLDRLRRIRTDLMVDIDAAEAEIYRQAGRRFNIKSVRDKQEVLFLPRKQGGQGLRPLKPTEGAKGKEREEMTVHDWSTDHATLTAYAGKPLVDAMLLYSAKTKLLSTYVVPYLGQKADPKNGKKEIVPRVRKGRIHGQFVQTGAESGRFSSREPNLQNIPSRSEDGKKLREIFVADPGTTLIVADYSQIEPRIIASLARDKHMISTYNDGGDVYQMVADRMGVIRPTGKELVLSIAYGVGSTTISTRIGCTPKEARSLMDFFLAKFPAIPRHRDAVIARARRDRFSTTVLGRKRPLERIAWSDQEERASAERQAYNHLIQGSAADVMKIALVNIHSSLPDEARLLMTVHDEVVVQAPDALVAEVCDLVRREMEAARPRAIIVPLVAEVGTGTSWADAK